MSCLVLGTTLVLRPDFVDMVLRPVWNHAGIAMRLGFYFQDVYLNPACSQFPCKSGQLTHPRSGQMTERVASQHLLL